MSSKNKLADTPDFFVFHIKGNKSKPIFSTEQEQMLTKSNLYSLCLIRRGETSFMINNERIQVGQHQLLLTSPATKVNSSSVVKSWDCEVYLIFFSMDFTFKLDFRKEFFDITKRSLGLNNNHILLLSSQESAHLANLFKQFIYYDKQEPSYIFKNQIIKSLTEILCCEIARLANQHTNNTSVISSRKQDILADFYLLLKRSFRQEHTVKFYATQLGISAKHLSVITKELTGKSAIELIQNVLVEEAKSLLHQGFSIGEIAKKLHFSDQSFFGKFFKRNVGISPKEFRQHL
ncbi:AraC family transcriptional regulator [Sphingobacterium sp. N143]|uniref:helix-turn-helix domain-containing protein n=1 Tax=Sphingobacterium sp. N143 TaxID=2746727 RepID=UPI0025767732|nr:helix-turn-helix domain-containing protein [Sphingobacterium sp. N143]MDM1294100.1 AraC family transcriptional regulator [Sphingobacterium sp. N143]